MVIFTRYYSHAKVGKLDCGKVDTSPVLGLDLFRVSCLV